MKYDIDLDYIRKLDRIHPYPAKFTVDIALKFIEQYSKEKDLILDPFCGSGTTLLASKILNRNSIGFDINHVAILISKFKILELTNKDLMYLDNFDLNNNIEIKKFAYL
ncbi:DNA methyltransferase [Brachyspira alvinipulli]|uniref:DNA methyltransferase n=1 Tax=Brachyspira alvinipulli TaxID=84379 RepID=UPI0004809561|nr:DNA methyltransferase [Brachyspira alvinipulli]